MPEPLSIKYLQSLINASLSGAFGHIVEYHPQIGSTNNRLRELAQSGAAHGTVVITDEQTAGRGRMGRQWHAPPHTAVLMSILFRPTLPPEQANRLVMCCGLAIKAAAPVELDVKWPNDLQIKGKKVAGILPESTILADGLDYVIIGTGINVNNTFDVTDPLFETATSLRDAHGEWIKRETLITAILSHLNSYYARIQHPHLHKEWANTCVTIGKRVKLDTRNQEYLCGIAEGITYEGRLQVRDESGELQTVSLSEATILSAKKA